MFRLTLLGPPGLVGADELPITGRATQRHRLALLALLALAPRPGISRDKLLAFLWPERDTEHARNLLKQAVHALRSALGEAAIVSTADELWLNPDIVTVDVHEYLMALSRSDQEAAVSLYRGPFLDGFFLSEAPEFERWTDSERQRLANEYAKALEALAERAEAANEWARAIELWKARAAHDPYDSRVVLRLMQALEANGNPGGALHHAATHAQLMQQEFGAEPSPEVVALTERMRTHPNGTAEARPDSAALENISGNYLTAVPHANDPSSRAPRATSILSSARRNHPARRHAPTLVLLVSLVSVAFWLGVRRPGNSTGAVQPSIAVLPFGNLSIDSADAVLADGITEELISMLASAGDLRVIASTSAAAFRKRDIEVRNIADSLGVNHVLEGSVQKVGESLRVKVRLVNGDDGSTRWSQAYERAFTGVFAVQDEIARAVAGELGMQFDKDRQLTRHNTKSAAAYQLYLRASDPVLLRAQRGIGQSEEYFKQALAIDPAYAAAHAGLALVYVRRARIASDPGMPVRRLLALADSEATRAVALDNGLAEAHYALAVVREVMLDLPTASREIRRAIEIDAHRSVYRRRLSYMHTWEGRADLELAEAQRALETDPLNPYAIAAVAGALYGNRRYDEALQQVERISAVQPPLQAYAFTVAQIYAKQQRWQEAIALLRPQAAAGDPLYNALLGYMLARAGQEEAAKQIIAKLSARPGTRAFQIAVVYAGLRDFDQAFAWLYRSIEDRSISSWIMGPTFEDLHRDPRLQQLRIRLGLHQRLILSRK